MTSAEDLEAAIVKHESGEDLIELLRAQAPHVSFPGISERDTPEQIRDQSYGWGFYESLEQTVDALVRRLDDLEMDELSRVADERGLTHSRKLLADARAALFELERSGPHGWGLALRLAEQVHAQSSRQTERLSKKLRTERLPPFPKPDQVESAFRGLREESTLRPRPYRLVAFGVLAAAVATALCAFLPKWIVVALLWRKVPLLSLAPSASSIRVTGPLAYVVEAPWVYLWLFCLFGAAIGFWLARHKKKRHEALLAARDDLRAAVGRFLSDAIEPSILRYYEARLAFVMRAWALRALSRLRDATSRDVDRLTGIGAALSRLRREFEGEASRMASESAGGEGGDLLYRTRASSELMASTYEAMRPPPDLAQKLFEQSLSEDRADAEDAPSYLLPDNVLAAVRPHVEPSSEVLGEHAGPFVVEFVRELSGKLGVPLEISGFDERTAEREYLFAPEWALAALGEAKQAARSLPQALAHGDPDRVHLVTVRTALTRESIVVLGEGKS